LKCSPNYDQIMEDQRTDSVARMGEVTNGYKMLVINSGGDVCVDVMIILKRILNK
jgi:hypothetical protein